MKAELKPLTRFIKEVFGEKGWGEKVVVSDWSVDSACVGSTSRQFHVFQHGVQEHRGGQPNTVSHDGVEEKWNMQTKLNRSCLSLRSSILP